MDTHARFFEALASVFNLIAIIAIPYSYSPDAAAYLRALNINVVTPELHAIPATLRSALDSSRDGTEAVVIEVGGYLADLVARGEIVEGSGIVGSVEDTTGGWLRYRALSSEQLRFPVAHVARSPLKEPEDHLTGWAVAHSTELLLRSLGEILVGKRVAVLGYGRIGGACAEAFRARRADVQIWDEDPIRVVLARAHGFGCAGRQQLLRQADLVIGATGRMSLTEADFSILRSGCVLVSASSRDVEFDLRSLDVAAVSTAILAPHVTEYRLRGGSRLVLLNEGRPVNFLHQGIVGRSLELVMCELLACASSIVGQRPLPGMYVLTQQSRRLLAQLWLQDDQTAVDLTRDTFTLVRDSGQGWVT